jgi:hypothetical protein
LEIGWSCEFEFTASTRAELSFETLFGWLG